MTRPRPDDRGEVILYRTEDGKDALDVRRVGQPLDPNIAEKAARPGRRACGFAGGNTRTGGEE